jgi:hypothetical protein
MYMKKIVLTKPQKRFASGLKHNFIPVCFLLTAILVIGSISIISSAFPINQSIKEPINIEVQALPSESKATSKPLDSIGFTPKFDVDVAYAYVGKGKSTPYTDFDYVVMYPITLYPSIVCLNFTHISTQTRQQYDAEIEVFLIEIASKTGRVENFTYFVGTNYSPRFSNITSLSSLTAHIDDLIDTRTVNKGGGGFGFNWTLNKSFLKYRIGSYGSYSNKPSELGLWKAGEPTAISVNISRIGSISLKDDSVTTTSAISKNIVHVNLEKSGDGFLYNELIPEDKLAQTDLFYPLP